MFGSLWLDDSKQGLPKSIAIVLALALLVYCTIVLSSLTFLSTETRVLSIYCVIYLLNGFLLLFITLVITKPIVTLFIAVLLLRLSEGAE